MFEKAAFATGIITYVARCVKKEAFVKYKHLGSTVVQYRQSVFFILRLQIYFVANDA